jgi:hypothetical protein
MLQSKPVNSSVGGVIPWLHSKRAVALCLGYATLRSEHQEDLADITSFDRAVCTGCLTC